MSASDSAATVLARAADIAGGEHRAAAWYRAPLREFGGRSPETLIAEGKLDVVLRYLDSIESGYVG
jgi:uncharacterized protein (DUF2384 family)